MNRFRVALLLFAALAFAAHAQEPAPAPKPGSPCVAVLASSPEELEAVEALLVPDRAKLPVTRFNGVEFRTAEVGGQTCVFFVTGPSLVNAAMNTQLALDRFNVRAVCFAGIAGGIDPALAPGDVVIPARWHYHSEAAYFNETAPGRFALAGYFKQKYRNFGMIFPDDVTVKREGMKDWEQVPSFPADDKLLAAAKRAADAMPPLRAGERACKVAVGGDGVSGPVFCDNAEYRKYVFEVWKAQCLDTESAAVAQVCWQSRTPCLVVRGLSDLAGGQAEANQVEQFRKLAADHAAAVLARILQTPEPPATPAASPSSAATPKPAP